MSEIKLCEYGGTDCEPATSLIFDPVDQEWVEACAECAQNAVEEDGWKIKPIEPGDAR